MITICYSGKSEPTALKLAQVSNVIRLNRGSRGDINWGRNRADTLLNPNISNATNKRVMCELFASHNVPAPRLYSPDGLSSASFPLVGRPDNHTKGRGFWLCHSMTDVVRAMRGTSRKRGATHFLEYITAPREYRVHIFKGKSIRISEKGYLTPNKRDGYITRKPQHNVKHVRRAAKAALEALGLDFGAVDVLADDQRCWVLECNTAPGLGGSMPSLYVNAFKEWHEQNQ